MFYKNYLNKCCIIFKHLTLDPIVTEYGLDGPVIKPWWGEIFTLSRPALGPNHPLVE